MPPNTSAQFDRAYSFPITLWGDIRVPDEIKALAKSGEPRRALELGCGVGRYSSYVAKQGIRATGVDFSEVAIAKARQRVAHDDRRPELMVGDVTHLDSLTGPFDISFDVGCFHCLSGGAQRAYISEIARLLRPHGTHLIWAIDDAPGGITLSPSLMRDVFSPSFVVSEARPSRRRFVRSHWYWLSRLPG